MIPTNLVTPSRVPKASTPQTEMYPFSEEELEELYGRAVCAPGVPPPVQTLPTGTILPKTTRSVWA